jgi:hypothetical protein
MRLFELIFEHPVATVFLIIFLGFAIANIISAIKGERE